MNQEDRVNFTLGFRVVELASFFVEPPEAEMSMSPEDITWPVKLDGTISYDDLLQKYERGVKNLEKYVQNVDALADDLARETVTLPTGGESAAELTERLAKEKQHANKLIHAMRKVLVKAKEEADEYDAIG